MERTIKDEFDRKVIRIFWVAEFMERTGAIPDIMVHSTFELGLQHLEREEALHQTAVRLVNFWCVCEPSYASELKDVNRAMEFQR